MTEEVAVGPEDKLIEEEYRIWKKNSPFLYDLVLTHALDWPSLTVQWLPNEVKGTSNKDLITHQLILGTQSDGTDPNYLMIADVILPNPEAPLDVRQYNPQKDELGNYGGTLSKISVKVKMLHDGDIHRARYMPQNPFVIAVKSPNAAVNVFNYSKHPSNPVDDVCRPNWVCRGHTEGGYALSWNPLVSGRLGSASSDDSICIWDVNDSATGAIDPIVQFSGHGKKAVNDLDWSHHHASIFATVGDDFALRVWDLRDNNQANALHTNEKEHAAEVNCLAFHPNNEFLLSTGDSSGAVKVWDLRNMSHCLHNLEGHKQGVYSLAWAPFEDSVLGSASEDRRVYLWDLSKIGSPQSEEDAEDGPPELLFIHGGHTAKVFDFSFNANAPWTVASVAEDNVLQVWQVAESIYDDSEDNEDDINDDDLEAEDDNNRRKKQKV